MIFIIRIQAFTLPAGPVESFPGIISCSPKVLERHPQRIYREQGAVFVCLRQAFTIRKYRCLVNASCVGYGFTRCHVGDDATAGNGSPAPVSIKRALDDYISLDNQRYFHGVATRAGYTGVAITLVDYTPIARVIHVFEY
jgi:hypothetical protein